MNVMNSMNRKVFCIYAVLLAGMLFAVSGCGEPARGVDLRNEGLVMKIPLKPVEGKIFLVEQVKGGGYKLEGKVYDIDSVIEALDAKPFIFRKGVCLKTTAGYKEETAAIDKFVDFCVERNIDLFIDVPRKAYLAKPENLDWVVQRKK